MPEAAADRVLPVPDRGRTFTAERLVRFGDLSPGGRVRFDALARYFQDISSDDTADVGLANDTAWVVRRTTIEVRRSPCFRERVSLTTFCSGIGRRWAERRVALTGEEGASVDAVSLWVHLDGRTGRPVVLPDEFHEAYDLAARGRTVSARLQHDATVPDRGRRLPWPLRFADFDLLGHVNNAATWAMVEEVLAAHEDLRPPFRAELEYRAAIERDDEVSLVCSPGATGFDLWVIAPGTGEGADPRVLATATVRPLDT